MAKPRIFISSTCYDLHELRSQIRNFVNQYGYEPVLSEFGDIFFSYDKHVQDSCLNEIERCQMFVLIIGDTFGSTYYKDMSQKTPRSVTMAEFKRAISLKIPRHIFINKYVEYDYKNYNRAWCKYIETLNKEGNLDSDDENRNKVRDKFDNGYSFNQESYRHLFKFIESVYQVEGINVDTFEYSEDIKNSLTKQWAGAMYEYLVSQTNVPMSYVDALSKKIDSMNDVLVNIVKTKETDNGGKISFDLSKIGSYGDWSDFQKIKEDVYRKLDKILFYTKPTLGPVISEGQKITDADVKKWIQDISNNMPIYKWQPYLSLRDVYNSIGNKMAYYKDTKIQVEDVLAFCNAIKACQDTFPEEEQYNLLKAIARCFEELPQDIELPF